MIFPKRYYQRNVLIEAKLYNKNDTCKSRNVNNFVFNFYFYRYLPLFTVILY